MINCLILKHTHTYTHYIIQKKSLFVYSEEHRKRREGSQGEMERKDIQDFKGTE